MVHVNIKSLHLWFFLLITGAAVAADEPVTFRASGPSQVVLDKPFQITFSINARGEDFRLPEIENFDVLAGPFTSTSSSVSFINGERKTTLSNKYTYTLLAKKTGRFTIPSASITVKKEKYTSNGLSIEVLPADTSQQPSQQDATQRQEQTGTNISHDNLFVRTIVSKTQVYEQEAILLTYRLYTTLDVVNFGVNKMPDFKGFMKNDLEIRPQANLEHYRGRNYTTVNLYQTILFPQRSGEVKIEPFEFDVVIRVQNPSTRRSIFDSFFDTYTNVSRSVTAPSATIQVEALPTANRPMAFNGTVGSFKMNSSLSTQEINANEAVTMTITIEGAGNMRMLKTPQVKFPESFEQYDPKVTNDFKVTTSGVTGKKTVEYLFIPRHSGEFDIPSVELCYFDTGTRSYQTLRTPAYQLKVMKGESSSSTVTTESFAAKEEVKQLGSDIRYIHAGKVAMAPERAPLIGSLISWIMFLVPLAVTLLLFILLSKQAKESANIRLVRNKKANKMARRRLKAAKKFLHEGKKDLFYDEVLKAVWTYLADKMSIPVSALNKENVEAELRSRQVNDELISAVTHVLDTCEFARYAPGSRQQEMGSLFDYAVHIIGDLEEQIKK